MRANDRRGFVLPLAFSIIGLLVIGVAGVHLMTRQTYRELEKLDGFLRAVTVAEACYQKQVGRLESLPWGERWFKGSPDTGNGSWMEGSYQYLIGDGDRDLEADLLVRAESDGSKVVMYWKLRADGTTLNPYRRVRATYFTYVDPATPVSGSGLSGLIPGLQESMQQREGNREWAEGVESRIGPGTGLNELPGLLGYSPEPPSPGGILPPTPEGVPPIPPGPPPFEIPELPGPQTIPEPVASPPSVADLGPLYLEVQQALIELTDEEGRVDRNLGGAAPVAGESPYSTFLGLERQVTERLSQCSETENTTPCPSGEVDQLNACKQAIAGVHNPLRPRYAALIPDIFRIKADLWNILSEIDAMRGNPALTQADVDEITGRSRTSIEEATRVATDLEGIYTEANTLLGEGCGDLWAPTLY